jgi:RNA polymerase sigma-70 factor (ECF subfamily)
MPDATPDDRYEQFVAFFTRNEPGLRSFVRSLVPSWDDADEVMQNTGLALWRKFSDFTLENDPQTDFFRWACVVARFEVLAWRRDKARDRHIFDEDLVGMLAEDAMREEKSLAAERKALEVCLAKLSDKQRKIVMAAYEPGVRLNRVAETLGKSATAFYKMLNRTRKSLLDCIESVSGDLRAEGGAQ